MRKSRHGEVTCTCRAYRFPHRFSGGKCDGSQMVEDHWEESYGGGVCAECLNLDDEYGVKACQVVNGAETVEHCPVWRDYVNDNEIKLTGPRWQQMK